MLTNKFKSIQNKNKIALLSNLLTKFLCPSHLNPSCRVINLIWSGYLQSFSKEYKQKFITTLIHQYVQTIHLT